MRLKTYRPQNRLLSAATSIELTTWISECLDCGSRYLAIDMSKVSFMDSRGLGALLISHNRVEKAGGKLGICALNGQARMLLDLTHVNQVLHIYDRLDDFERSLPDFKIA